MIIVTLVATLAAAMVWQQWRSVQVEAAERARAQAAWILSGALDFAKLILREDSRSGRPTALTEPWATPLAESRLSTFLAVDKSNADDGPEAFLSGSIADAQGLYNLTNLVNQGKVDPDELANFERLCSAVNVDASVAQRIATNLRDASAGTSAAVPIKPASVAQLTWFGIDEATVHALEQFVVLLPTITAINVNTAANEVLSAVVPGLDTGTAAHLAQVRQRTPFKSLAEFYAQAQLTIPTTAPPKLDVRSNYFEVRTRLRLVDRILVERSLLQRLPNGQSIVLLRERVAGLDQVGS